MELYKKMELIISHKTTEKLRDKHGVSKEDVEECFITREKGFLGDSREEHKTNPPTQWFISDTYLGRRLKVCFMLKDNGEVIIKSAFAPNEKEEDIYKKHAF